MEDALPLADALELCDAEPPLELEWEEEADEPLELECDDEPPPL